MTQLVVSTVACRASRPTHADILGRPLGHGRDLNQLGQRGVHGVTSVVAERGAFGNRPPGWKNTSSVHVLRSDPSGA